MTGTMRTIESVMYALALVAATPAALAEKADRDKPIHLDSERASVDTLKNLRILEGNVELSQGTMRIHAERIEIRSDDDNAISAFATGNPVKFSQKREGCDEYIEAFAGRVEFDDRTGILKLISRAYLKSGEDEIRSELITYNSETDQYQAAGARAESPQGGRVRMVIQPKNEKKSVACGGKSAKPGVKSP